MRRSRWSAMAMIVVMLVILCALFISFLPFFVEGAWASLWDVAYQPLDAPLRAFDHAGPWVGVLPWAAYLALPISSLMVLVWFTLIAAVILLRRSR